ncbi:hypothetical protein [Nitrospira sp. Nam74]
MDQISSQNILDTCFTLLPSSAERYRRRIESSVEESCNCGERSAYAGGSKRGRLRCFEKQSFVWSLDECVPRTPTAVDPIRTDIRKSLLTMPPSGGPERANERGFLYTRHGCGSAQDCRRNGAQQSHATEKAVE